MHHGLLRLTAWARRPYNKRSCRENKPGFAVVERPCLRKSMQHMHWFGASCVTLPAILDRAKTERGLRRCPVSFWQQSKVQTGFQYFERPRPWDFTSHAATSGPLHPLLIRRHPSDRRRGGAWRADLRLFESLHLMSIIWLYVQIFSLWSLTRSCSHHDPLGIFARITLSCS